MRPSPPREEDPSLAEIAIKATTSAAVAAAGGDGGDDGDAATGALLDSVVEDQVSPVLRCGRTRGRAADEMCQNAVRSVFAVGLWAWAAYICALY